MQIKNLLKHNLVAIAAIIITIATMSFKTASPDAAKLATNYHYKIASTNISDLRTLSNWEVGTGSDCNTGTDVPCVISYTASMSDPTFQDFLNNRNLAQLNAAASSKRISE